MSDDPYRAEPSPELDVFIHTRLMKLEASAEGCPPYSTEDKFAERVLSRLKKGRSTVVIGRTSLKGRTWFARYEKNVMDGTEVFADTFALAVCRLALLQLEETGAGRWRPTNVS